MDYYYSGGTFVDYAHNQADANGGYPGGWGNGGDNMYDAYRHALLQAKLTDHLGTDLAKSIGDQHEVEGVATTPDPRSTNMDYYNNDVGRNEYWNWRTARENGSTVSLEKWIYDVVASGKTINSLDDPRQWVEHPPAPDSIPPAPWSNPMGDMPNGISPNIGTNPDPKVKTKVVRYVDPLILDLDGDGLEITPLSKGVLFDANGDTIKTGTAWAAADDGMLVWDRNGNGLIDSGAELFGDETVLTSGPNAGKKAANGFVALAELDSNADGKFDLSDAQYATLRVWRDLNQDGISQAGELKSLADTGVKSINLTSAASNASYPDAILAQSGSYTRADDSSGQAGSFILAQNNFVRQFAPIAISAQAKAVANIGGSGWVRDLQAAATQSPELIGLFNQVKHATTRDGYQHAVGALMQAWGNDSGYNSASKQALAEGYGLILSDPLDDQERGWMDVAIKAGVAERSAFRTTLSGTELSKFDAMRERMVGGLERVQAYEAFTGYTFLDWAQVKGDALNWDQFQRLFNSGGGRIPVIVEIEMSLREIMFQNRNATVSSQGGYIRVTIPVPTNGTPQVDSLWARLLDDAQANLLPVMRLNSYVDQIDLRISEAGTTFDFTRMNASLAALASTNAYEGAALLLDFNKAFGASFAPLGWNGADQIVALALRAATEPAVAQAFADVGYNVMTGAASAGTAGRDIYAGDSAGNTFQAALGADILDGKGGNDTLYGGAGDDLLIGGTGNDVLNGGSGNNVYVFGAGDGQDMIEASYDTAAAKASIVQFRAGISASSVAVKRSGSDLILSVAGSSDTITVQYFFYSDSPSNTYNPVQEVRFADGTRWSAQELTRQAMVGTGAADQLRGAVGADLLLGGAGADTLYGMAGNDVLDGGAGNDYLQGDAGADIYRFTRGCGQDVINNYEAIEGNGNGAKPVDAIVFGPGIAPGDIVLTRNWYGDLTLSIAGGSDSVTISNYFSNDGATSYAVDEIRFADNTVWRVAEVKARALLANEAGSTLFGFESDDVIAGAVGNDVVYARSGNDSVDGNGGNDGLYGEAGNDVLRGGAGRDYLDGGAGNDNLDGGADDDQLTGGDGADTYRFGRGYGKDSINNYDADASIDSLVLGAGITQADIEVRRSAWNELVLSIKGTPDVLTVAQFFSADGTTPYALDRIVFADNSVWDIAAIKARVLAPTAGSDSLVGYAGADSISGGDGADALRGAAGNDVLDGDAGNDTLYGEAGNDTLRGGSGADYLNGGDSDDVLQGGADDDVLVGGVGNDNLEGGLGNDSLHGGEGDDTYLFGVGDGQDIVDEAGYSGSAGGADTLRLRAGVSATTVGLVRSGNDILLTLPSRLENGVPVTDSVRLQNALQNDGDNVQKIEYVVFDDGTTWTLEQLKLRLLTGGAGGDTLTGYALADTLDGLAGNDWLDGLAGADTLLGGDGDDRLDGGAGDDVLDGGAGADLLLGGADNNTYLLKAGSGQDVLVRNFLDTAAATDTILVSAEIGLAGVELLRDNNDVVVRIRATQDAIRLRDVMLNDGVFEHYSFRLKSADGSTLQGAALRQALLNGGTGDDVLTGYASDDALSGGAGNDTLSGLTGVDRLYGNDGNDQLFGGAGADSLEGGLGDDQLDGGEGADMLTGGAGNDTYVLDDAGDRFTELSNEGVDTIVSSVSVTLGNNFENGTMTGDLNLALTGNALANILTGNAGDNVIAGGAGNDVIDGGAGLDALSGGAGDDLYYVDQTGDVVLEAANEGVDTVHATASTTLSANVENLVLASSGGAIDGSGNALANRMTGNDYANRLDGGAGADVLEGLMGDDTYVVDNLADQVIEAADAGFDTVETGLSYTLGANLEGLLLTGYSAVNGTGNEGDNTLIGNAANNILSGGIGNDELQGAGGNDILDGGQGSDDMAGGAGNDTYYADSQSDRIFESFGEGIDTEIRSFETSYLLANAVDNLTLTGTVYRGNGNGLDNVITGNDADNNLLGLGGNDMLIGGAGNDALFGSVGQDTLLGGLGDDYYEIDDAGDAIVEQANEGDDFVRATVSWTLGANLERLAVDGTAALSVTGNALNNGLWGNQGNNILTGGLGNDFLSGDQGNDVYLFSRGDGQDSIDNTDLLGATDTLRLGSGIAETDVQAFQSGANLFFKIKGTNDQIGLINYYGANTTVAGQAADHKIDRIEFASGASWDQAMIQTVVDRAKNNHAPVINNYLPALQAKAGSVFSYTVAANTITDPDAWDSITYSIKMADGSAVPAWLSFDAATRTMSGTPGAGNVGALQFILWGTDGYNSSAGEYVNMTIGALNRAPVLSAALADQAASLGAAFSYTVAANAFTDPDSGDTLGYSATLADGSALPSWLSFNAATRVFSGTPPSTGTVSVKVTSKDSGNLTASDVFDIVVSLTNQTLNGTAGADTLVGGAGNDTLNGLAGNDTLNGGAGNDLLNGGTGNDAMAGGTGDDTYVVDSATDVTTEAAGAGTDLVQSSVSYTLAANLENLTLTGVAAVNAGGNAGDNYLTGNSAINTLTGAAGNDTLDGGAGADLLLGGLGNDTYVVENTGDVITENLNEGTDLVQSSVSYTLAANVDNLTLTGSSALNGTGNALNNVLTGNSAANTLNGGAGADSMAGAAGDDVYVVDNGLDVIAENAGQGMDLVQSSVSYSLAANVEHLTLTGTGAINGTGNGSDNIMMGNAAANVLAGGAGNDTLNGGAGIDTMQGGTGNDSYVVDNSATIVTENLNEGTDLVQSSVAFTLGANVENLTLTGATAINGTGNAAANILIGNSAINTLVGAAGNDSLDGGAGADKLLGGLGDDVYVVDNAGDLITENVNEGTDLVQSGVTYTLAGNVENLTLTGATAINGIGNTLNNVLVGNSGINTLTGNAGADTLDGGAGADILQGGAGNDTYLLGRGYGIDTIIENDATAGNIDLAQFGSGITTDQLWFQRVGNNLQVDIIGTADRFVLNSWYLGNQYHVEQFKTSDGKVLLDSQVQNLVNAMAGFAPPAAGQTTLSTAYQTTLIPTITANWH